MSGELSKEGGQLALRFLLGIPDSGGKPPELPPERYLALLTAAPPPEATMANLAELETVGYVRAPVGTWRMPDTMPASASNDGAVEFGPFGDDMTEPVTHAALVTDGASTAGTFVMWWELDQEVQALKGQVVRFAPDRLTRTII
ncbi:phage tail fiber protein [Actinomadura atramentaria]|uniref:phage tail fiber protein n=1 Tax=Actinomadura atramentaria TaxID=1990 RepID=UPI0012FB5B25|nr:hypothetical protein [Actinomadura atramentaria]